MFLWVPDLTCDFVHACLASELLGSMGPRPHLRFWHAKQRLLDLNYNSLWVPDLNFRFVYTKQHD